MFFQLSDFGHDPETQEVVVTNQYGVVVKEESWPPSSNIKPTRKPLQILKVHLQVAIKDRVQDTVSELGRVKKINSRVSSASWAIPCEYYYKARTQHRPGVVTATVVVYPSATIPLDITLVTKDDVRIISTVAVLHFKDESELKKHRGSQWCLENDEDYVFPIADQIEAFVPDAEHENVPPVYHELRMVYEHARTIIRPDHEVELIVTVSLEDFQESIRGILKTLGFPPRESSVCSSQCLTFVDCCLLWNRNTRDTITCSFRRRSPSPSSWISWLASAPPSCHLSQRPRSRRSNPDFTTAPNTTRSSYISVR